MDRAKKSATPQVNPVVPVFPTCWCGLTSQLVTSDVAWKHLVEFRRAVYGWRTNVPHAALCDSWDGASGTDTFVLPKAVCLVGTVRVSSTHFSREWRETRLRHQRFRHLLSTRHSTTAEAETRTTFAPARHRLNAEAHTEGLTMIHVGALKFLQSFSRAIEVGRGVDRPINVTHGHR